MKRDVSAHLLMSAAAFLLGAVFSTASAKPIQDEISQARSDCHDHKLQVKALEGKLKGSDPRLAQERQVWELSCVHAQSLIDARAHVARLGGDAFRPAITQAEFAEFQACGRAEAQGAPVQPLNQPPPGLDPKRP